MRAVLTEIGKEKVRDYLAELKAKRKEILDARKDTASFYTPTIGDVIEDISSYSTDLECYTELWRCTDNYDADTTLVLAVGVDFYWDKEKPFMIKLYFLTDDRKRGALKGNTKGHLYFDSLEDAEEVYSKLFEYNLFAYNPTVWKYDDAEGRYVRMGGY